MSTYRENKRRKKNFLKVCSLSGLLCTKKSAKSRPHFSSAAQSFIWPFLSYAAEESASWQHCCVRIPDQRKTEK
jgi:hypothetical protein